jgi:hypothetical protein
VHDRHTHMYKSHMVFVQRGSVSALRRLDNVRTVEKIELSQYSRLDIHSGDSRMVVAAPLLSSVARGCLNFHPHQQSYAGIVVKIHSTMPRAISQAMVVVGDLNVRCQTPIARARRKMIR